MNHRLKITATVLCALCVVIAAEAPAAPLPREGYFGRVGLGYSPYARTALDLSAAAVKETGVAPSLSVGLIWDRAHSVEFRWQNIYFLGDTNGSQGALCFSYTRYFQKRGPAPFLSLGFGLQWGPFPAVSPTSELETDEGVALTFGGGVRFSRQTLARVDYSFGSTNKFINSNNNFDYRHRQLVFSLQYTLFGG